MALGTQRGRWIQRAEHTLVFLEPIAKSWPLNARLVMPSALCGLQRQVGELLGTGSSDIPKDQALAEVIETLIVVRNDFLALTEVPGGGKGLRERIARIRTVSQDTHSRLVTDEQLCFQSVDQVIEEYRMSLILNITANHVLSQRVANWQGSRKNAQVGPHPDLLTLEFTDDTGPGSIPMASLAAASTGMPVVVTPNNFGSAMHEMKSGGAPPPIYRMAYLQWFTTITASWEDIYRPRRIAMTKTVRHGQRTTLGQNFSRRSRKFVMILHTTRVRVSIAVTVSCLIGLNRASLSLLLRGKCWTC